MASKPTSTNPNAVLSKIGKPVFVGVDQAGKAAGYSTELKPLMVGLTDGSLKGVVIYVNNIKVSL